MGAQQSAGFGLKAIVCQTPIKANDAPEVQCELKTESSGSQMDKVFPGLRVINGIKCHRQVESGEELAISYRNTSVIKGLNKSLFTRVMRAKA